jgi:O-antigen ligase
MPGIVLPFAALPFGLVAAWFVLRNPKTILITTILLSSFVVYNAPGLDPGELMYYGMWLVTVLLVLIPQVYRAELRIQSSLDKLFILLLLTMATGVVIGFFTAPNRAEIFIEVLYFYSGIVFYFAIRPHLDNKAFRTALLISLLLIFLYVVFRTYTSYRSAILSAVAEWQLNFARGSGNENFLLAGTIITAAALLYVQKFWHKVALIATLALSVGAVIVTLTRSLWVVTVLGLIIVAYYVGPAEKKRLFSYFVAAVAVIATVGLIYIDVTLFILDLLLYRFKSFGAGLADVSLADRIYETQRVWEKIMQNPITGWGFGAEYLKYDVIIRRTSSYTSYIHNGYLAMWFKIGILGLITIIAYGVTLFRTALRIFRHTHSTVMRTVCITIMAYLPAAALMNITSPVLSTYEGILLLILFGSVVSWYSSTYPDQAGIDPK